MVYLLILLSLFSGCAWHEDPDTRPSLTDPEPVGVGPEIGTGPIDLEEN